MTKSPNKTELNVGEMPKKILIKCAKCKCQMTEEDFTKEAMQSFKKGDCMLECHECFTDGYED